MDQHFVITIGREYGSGGREIGRLIAEKLNVKCYDKELLALAAQESGICHEVLENHDEKASVASLLPMSPGMAFGGVSAGLQMPMNQRVFLAQFEVITRLARQESCVIVGRCGDYILREMEHVTHVFLYAAPEKRIQRIMRIENVEEDKAREMIRKTDKQRRSYYNFFADGNWGLRSNYDLMLRTDGHTPQEIADMIIAFAGAKPVE
ncbi:MAG: cytidylate kinase-like family protein [Clostridiales bacterium]|nr:cytidylate kinase-like family protein [Clostridiales bacterium]